jgi:hypothetical protein
MQGLARFSLVAVIVLAAILLGSWAYLTARYGSVEEFMASEDSSYWRPGSPSEAHDDLESEASEERSPAERAAAEVKSGTAHPEESGDWRRVPSAEPKQNPTTDTPDSEKAEVSATLDDSFTDSVIETDDENLTAASRDHALKPFFARTRPTNLKDREGYLSDERIVLLTDPKRWNDELKKAMKANPVAMVPGVVEDKIRRKPLANVVVAPIDRVTRKPSRTRAVSNESGRFLLLVPAAELKTLAYKGENFELAVIADGFEPSDARKDALVISARSSTKEVKVPMGQDKGVRVRVTVANLNMTTEPVRIWAEFRASETSALFDDAIFMSVDAPKSGSVVFRFPHIVAGTVRVGAGGNNCSCREVLEVDTAKNGALACSLRLVPARTYYMRGSIAGIGVKAAGPTCAARIESLPYHDVAYTDERGMYEFSVRLAETGELTRIQVSARNVLEREFELDEKQFPEDSKGYLRVIRIPDTGEPFWVFVQPYIAQIVLVKLPEADRDIWENRMFKIVALDGSDGDKEETATGSRVAGGSVEFYGLRWGTELFEIRDPDAAKDRQVLARYMVLRKAWTNPVYLENGRTIVLEAAPVQLPKD